MKTTKKGAPSWRKGVWLTKSNTSDVHVAGVGMHIVCTRSVRRLPKQWGLKLAGDVVAEPWCFGLASLGRKLVSTKRILPPQPLTYAVASQGTPDEAASDPETPPEASASPVMIPDGMTLDELAKQAPASGRRGLQLMVKLLQVPCLVQFQVIQLCRTHHWLEVQMMIPEMLQIVQQRPHVLIHQTNKRCRFLIHLDP